MYILWSCDSYRPTYEHMNILLCYCIWMDMHAWPHMICMTRGHCKAFNQWGRMLTTAEQGIGDSWWRPRQRQATGCTVWVLDQSNHSSSHLWGLKRHALIKHSQVNLLQIIHQSRNTKRRVRHYHRSRRERSVCMCAWVLKEEDKYICSQLLLKELERIWLQLNKLQNQTHIIRLFINTALSGPDSVASVIKPTLLVRGDGVWNEIVEIRPHPTRG